MNLQTMIEGRKFRDGLQQWGEAKAVESEGISCSKVVIEEKSVVRCGATGEMAEELVGEMGICVWKLGENRECVVEG